MVFGIFDPPQTKAQKRAAKAAQQMREQAVRDALIEINMLIKQQERARQLQVRLFDADRDDDAKELMLAGYTAQDTIDKLGRFSDMFPIELADLQKNATNAATFEALATFELEGRDFMIAVRDEAKAQLVPLGVMVMEKSKLLG